MLVRRRDSRERPDPISDFASGIAEEFLKVARLEIEELWAQKHSPEAQSRWREKFGSQVAGWAEEPSAAKWVEINLNEIRSYGERDYDLVNLRHILVKVASRLLRDEITEAVIGEFQPQIEAAALRRLEVSSFEELTEKYLEGLIEQEKAKEVNYRRDDEDYVRDALWELADIQYQTEHEVREEVFAEQIEAAVAQRIAAEQKGDSNAPA
jgi:hypothetical protein